MKRYTALLLTMALLFSLAGCSKKPAATNSSPTKDSNDVTDIRSDAPVDLTESTVQQKPMVSVSVPVITETVTAADGTVIFNYTYQNMALIVPDPDVANKVIIDFLNRIDQTTSTAESILASAKSEYIAVDYWNPYLCQITYDPMRIDSGVLSLFGSHATYSGTPHPEANYLSVSYDLVTGDVLSLDDILTENATSDTLRQYVIDVLNTQKEKSYLYEGFEETVSDRFTNELSHDEDWYFSETGLCFYFSPYEIAPYSSGAIVAEIPYEMLTGIINDAYFPAEKETAIGTIEAELFLDTDYDRFTQFAEIVLDTSGDKILLHTDKYVQNIRIETGSWSANGANYTAEHTVFAASSLTPGDAIMVETALTASSPNLRLSYQAGDETVSVFITGTAGSSVELI